MIKHLKISILLIALLQLISCNLNNETNEKPSQSYSCPAPDTSSGTHQMVVYYPQKGMTFKRGDTITLRWTYEFENWASGYRIYFMNSEGEDFGEILDFTAEDNIRHLTEDAYGCDSTQWVVGDGLPDGYSGKVSFVVADYADESINAKSPVFIVKF